MAQTQAYEGQPLTNECKILPLQGVVFFMVPYSTPNGWKKIQGTLGREFVDSGLTLECIYRGVRWVLWKPKFILETATVARDILLKADEKQSHVSLLRKIYSKAFEGDGVSLCFFEHKVPDHVSFPEEYAGFLNGVRKTNLQRNTNRNGKPATRVRPIVTARERSACAWALPRTAAAR